MSGNNINNSNDGDNVENDEIQRINSITIQSSDTCKSFIENQLLYLYLKYKITLGTTTTSQDSINSRLIQSLESFGENHQSFIYDCFIDLLKLYNNQINNNIIEYSKTINILSVYNLLLNGLLNKSDSYNSLNENEDEFAKYLDRYSQSIDGLISLLAIPSFISEIEQQKLYNNEEYEQLEKKSKELVNFNRLVFKLLSKMMTLKDNYMVTKKYHWSSVLVTDKLLITLILYINSDRIYRETEFKDEKTDLDSFIQKRLYWSDNDEIDSIAQQLLFKLLELSDTSSLIELYNQKKMLLLKYLSPFIADNESQWCYNLSLIQTFTTIISLTKGNETLQLLDLFNPHLVNIVLNLIHCSFKPLKVHGCRVLRYLMDQLNEPKSKSLLFFNNNIYDKLLQIIQNEIENPTLIQISSDLLFRILYLAVPIDISIISHPLFIPASDNNSNKSKNSSGNNDSNNFKLDPYISIVNLIIQTISTQLKKDETNFKKQCLLQHSILLFRKMGIYITVTFKSLIPALLSVISEKELTLPILLSMLEIFKSSWVRLPNYKNTILPVLHQHLSIIDNDNEKKKDPSTNEATSIQQKSIIKELLDIIDVI